jgi:hypothetical protein
VLAHSLRDAGTKKQLVAMVTLDSVSTASIEQLKVGDTLMSKELPADNYRRFTTRSSRSTASPTSPPQTSISWTARISAPSLRKSLYGDRLTSSGWFTSTQTWWHCGPPTSCSGESRPLRRRRMWAGRIASTAG